MWLNELARGLGRRVTLDDIADAELDRLAASGFDWVWLLSVWLTGSAEQRISRANRAWRGAFEDTLPDLCDEDIAGSGFAIPGLHDIPRCLLYWGRRYQALSDGPSIGRRWHSQGPRFSSG